jgi:aspartate ammonia-lyase
MRTEQDFIGKLEIPEDALYGIHSMRAKENFPDSTLFDFEWYKSLATVKKACYHTVLKFYEELEKKSLLHEMSLRIIDKKILELMIESCSEIEQGKYFEFFIVPAISGGAGTSINMNMNEIIANASLLRLGKSLGSYDIIDPVEHANIFQSTNDVIPTSLKVTLIRKLEVLEKEINCTRSSVESLEKKYRNVMRIGYTQMQEAVPSSYGRLFSSYNDALSRDWWRTSKCFERIKVINLGGSAIGSGITVPRFFIMESIQMLQQITGLPITRAENMHDATSNLDSFVEIHAILKAHAVNLEKMVNDMRLLASDLIYRKELSIPKKQVGSSIMPAKINPVIPEFVISAIHKIYANDGLISSLCGQGCLDLNAYLPVIGYALLNSLDLLAACNKTVAFNLTGELEISGSVSEDKLLHSSALATALLPYIGYHKASELAKEMQEKKINIYQANENLKIIPENKLRKILKPENLLKEGFSVNDIRKMNEDD